MSRLRIDIHRQFSRRLVSISSLRREWSTGTGRHFFLETFRVLSLFGMPVGVAALFTLAFLASDTQPEADKFIFFGTLYAFWLGLFGSCQILNGSVASGEWSYWVLGHRFGFGRHLLANLLVSFAAVSLQVVSFLSSLVTFDHLLSHGRMMPALKAGSFFVQQPGEGIMTFFQAQAFTTITLGLALITAGFSGACLGALFSACFRETADSMRAAVVFMVVQSVISSTVLIESGMKSRFPLLAVWWDLPQKSAFVDDLRDPDSTFKLLGRHRGDRLLEDFSFLLPQRYFYNVAGILTSKVCVVDLDKGPKSAPEKALNTAFEKDPALWLKICQWSDTRPDSLRWTNGKRIPAVHPRGDEFLPFTLFVYGHLILPELTALFVIALFHVAITYIIIRKRECFHTLR